MQTGDDAILVKIAILIAVLALSAFLMNMFLRKWLNVERRKPFSSNYINQTHKKFDISIRLAMVAAAFIVLAFDMSDPERVDYSPFLTVGIVTVFGMVSEGTRAFFERKYKPETNDYVFSLLQIPLLLIIILLGFIIITTSWFGL